jgi:hypothetical protein
MNWTNSFADKSIIIFNDDSVFLVEHRRSESCDFLIGWFVDRPAGKFQLA